MRFCLTPTTRMILPSICVLIFSTPLHATAQSPGRGSSVRKHKDPARDVRFSSGQSSLKLPFELSNNFILLQVQVNHSRPLWFVFDTGSSSSIINARLIKELNLQTKGRIRGSATGKAIEAELISSTFKHYAFVTQPARGLVSDLNNGASKSAPYRHIEDRWYLALDDAD
jgi:hypothetical protein